MSKTLVKYSREIRQTLDQLTGNCTDKKYLVAVSGGADSVFLARILNALKLNMALAHVNYHQRGKESDADEKFCLALAKELGCKLFTRSFSNKTLAKSSSFQEQARDFRYSFFNEVMEKEKIDYIVLAHHANDQAETVLLQLFRGATVNGLGGMKMEDGKKLRPLLNITKDEILDALKSEGWRWREDKSNAISDYNRNFIRNKVLPLVEKRWPGIVQTLVKNASIIQEQAKVLKAINTVSFSFDKDFIVKRKDIFDSPVRLNFMKALHENGFDKKSVAKILLAKPETESKTFSSKQGILVIKSEEIAFYKEKPGQAILLNKGSNWVVKGIDLSFLKETEEYINAVSIKGGLNLRCWNSGDKFRPLGMKGFKKVSDFLTGLKLNSVQKAKVMVLEDEEKVVWLVGFRIDDRVKIEQGQTKKILHLRAEK